MSASENYWRTALLLLPAAVTLSAAAAAPSTPYQPLAFWWGTAGKARSPTAR
jgi:hypothetical protein